MATTKIPFRQRRPLLDQSQSIQVHYLGWSGPILHAACDYLQEHYTREAFGGAFGDRAYFSGGGCSGIDIPYDDATKVLRPSTQRE